VNGRDDLLRAAVYAAFDAREQQPGYATACERANRHRDRALLARDLFLGGLRTPRWTPHEGRGLDEFTLRRFLRLEGKGEELRLPDLRFNPQSERRLNRLTRIQGRWIKAVLLAHELRRHPEFLGRVAQAVAVHRQWPLIEYEQAILRVQRREAEYSEWLIDTADRLCEGQAVANA
jgi:hypothetical protein